ncbi:MAG: methyl-accepting chemotaxis protein [Thermodesulfovibrionia bacterium]|nr:methyl-accepting chemotaxis protein [Thermodesulfovibrionia bacterium]
MKYRRKQYITDKRYQWRIALRIISICFIYLLFNLLLFNYLTYKKLEFLRWKMHLPVETIGEIIKPYLLSSTILSIFFTVVTLFIFIRYIFKKTSCPIHRLKTDIEKVADGDLSTNIYLRKGDDFKDTANDCSRMVSALRDNFVFIKNGFSVIERILEKMEYIKDKPDIAKKECKVLMETIDSLRKGIKR